VIRFARRRGKKNGRRRSREAVPGGYWRNFGFSGRSDHEASTHPANAGAPNFSAPLRLRAFRPYGSIDLFLGSSVLISRERSR
jgi:hypothetical protein